GQASLAPAGGVFFGAQGEKIASRGRRGSKLCCRRHVESGFCRSTNSEGRSDRLAQAHLEEDIMTQYLVALPLPEDYDPALEKEETRRDITALNEEMKAGGVRVFVGGLEPARQARSLRGQPGGKVLVTDGPYLETKEHVGGFWVLEAADLEAALEW